MEENRSVSHSQKPPLRVDLNDFIASNNQSSGDEPTSDSIRISVQWGYIWPKVIARAWKGQKYPAVQDGGKAKHPDRQFYEDLVSGNPELVKKCLKQEGFDPNQYYYGKYDKVNDNWYWKNVCIIVRERDSDIHIDSVDKFLRNDRYSRELLDNVSIEINNGIERMLCNEIEVANGTVLLTEHLDEIGIKSIIRDVCTDAITGNTPPKFTNISNDIFEKIFERNKEIAKKYKGSDKRSEIIKKLTTDVIGKQIVENIRAICDSYEKNLDNSINGWSNVTGLQHFIILTLPPLPGDEPGEWSAAMVDYIASGRVYPFTVGGSN